MPFKEGNKYWTYRDWFGTKKKFTPEELFDESNKYFKWCVDNPLLEEQLFNTKFGIKREAVSKMRPFTIQGLCTFLGIVVKTFDNYGKLKKTAETELEHNSANDYLQVVTYVRQIIYNQKFEGAATGFFNANIIVRDLGLVNKEENTLVVEQPLFPEAHPDERESDPE